MKKKIATVGALVLAVSLSLFIYNEIIAKSFRYSTPLEAFEKSGPRNSEIVDVLEDKDIAMIVFKKANGASSIHITAKDSRGWTPLSVSYKNKRNLSLSNGFINIKDINGKSIVDVRFVIDVNSNIPTISDSLNSTFLVGTYEYDSGRKLVYGFLVSEEKFPEDYRIKLGEQEIEVY